MSLACPPPPRRAGSGGRWALIIVVVAGLAAGAGCGRSDSVEAARGTNVVGTVVGQPIRPLATERATNVGGPTLTNRGVRRLSTTLGGGGAGAVTSSVPPLPPEPPGLTKDGYERVGFETLSDFPYRVYEYYAEGVSGRPLLRSDDVIPPAIRAYHERRVTVRGFVLPLRTRKGLVTEFLLMRDQGTCCFGAQAQINHFIRVNHPKGREFTSGLPYRVAGVLKVGETYVQGYLTGIYQIDADRVTEAAERAE